MSKKIIAIDADDTLFDENTAVRLFHNQEYGTAHTAEDYQVPGEFHSYFATVWGVDQAEADRRYEEFVQWKLEHVLPPQPGALEVLRSLQSRYDFVVVTMRDEQSVAITHESLVKHYPDIFKDVHFVPLWGGTDTATKAKICNEIGAEYLIDDGFHHCELAAEAGIQGLLFGEYGWSSDMVLKPGMSRVKDWGAVREYFDAA